MNKTLRGNARAIVCFELLYKAASLAIFAPLLYGLFQLSMRAAGMSYLSAINFKSYLTAPTTAIILLVILVLAAFYTVFDMIAVLYGFDCAHRGVSVDVYALLRGGLRQTRMVCRRSHLLPLLYALLVLPIISVGMRSGSGSLLPLPAFLDWYVSKKAGLQTAYYALQVPLAALAFFGLFSLYCACLEHTGFRESIRRSVRLVLTHPVKILAALVGWNLVHYALYLILGTGGIAVARLICGCFLNVELLYAVVLSFSVTFLVVVSVLLSCCTVPAATAIVSFLYYRCAEPSEWIESEPVKPLSPAVRVRFRRVTAALCAVSVLVCCLYVNEVRLGRVGLSGGITVTAHRGDSVNYPENTMLAFESAVENGADCLELDVQQTADGVLVVMHDSSLRRTTGVRANIWDITYDELSQLDCGSWFDSAYSDARVPTLAEVLSYAAEVGIRLNIELKPTGHETDFEAAVAELVAEYGMEDDCIVTSMSYDVLERIKEVAPDLTTAYVMRIAYGKITDLTCADEFSVQASFVTRSLVRRIHAEDKLIHVWTVNSESVMTKMIGLGVDDIITDDVILAQETIAEERSNDQIIEYVRLITGKEEEE